MRLEVRVLLSAGGEAERQGFSGEGSLSDQFRSKRSSDLKKLFKDIHLLREQQRMMKERQRDESGRGEEVSVATSLLEVGAPRPNLLAVDRVVRESRCCIAFPSIVVGLTRSPSNRRSLLFSVEDRFSIVIPRLPRGGGDGEGEGDEDGQGAVSAVLLTVTETLPAFFDILLDQYTYRIESSDGRNNHGETDRPVKLEPSFRLSSGDCLPRRPDSPFCERHLTWSLDLTQAWRASTNSCNSCEVDLSVLTRFSATRRFVRRELLPPDASRGLLLPPAFAQLLVSFRPSNQTSPPPGPLDSRCLRVMRASGRGGEVCRATAFSGSSLLTMPIPDLSMPYNVLTLVRAVLMNRALYPMRKMKDVLLLCVSQVSTFAAFFLGSVVNAFYRRRTPAK